jgi:hypothetical protein
MRDFVKHGAERNEVVGVGEPIADHLPLAEQLHNCPYSKYGCKRETSRALYYCPRRLQGRKAVHQKTSIYPSLDRLQATSNSNISL